MEWQAHTQFPLWLRGVKDDGEPGMDEIADLLGERFNRHDLFIVDVLNTGSICFDKPQHRLGIIFYIEERAALRAAPKDGERGSIALRLEHECGDDVAVFAEGVPRTIGPDRTDDEQWKIVRARRNEPGQFTQSLAEHVAVDRCSLREREYVALGRNISRTKERNRHRTRGTEAVDQGVRH